MLHQRYPANIDIFIDSWLAGFSAWHFQTNVHMVIVVILDMFARSAQTDVRERSFMQFCRISFNW